MLWKQALYAIPFALFFGTLYGATLTAYRDALIVSTYFTYAIGIALWVVHTFVRPRLDSAGDEVAPGRSIQISMLYGVSAVIAGFGAALLLQFTIMPGILGNFRNVLMFGMFTLLFSVLFIGTSLAMTFYRKSLDKARTEEELKLARRIQRSFLLSQFPERPRLEVHAVNISSKQVSGDFYDVVPAGEHAFLLAIADVAGKGVGAALMSSMLQASLRTQANRVESVAEILRAINTLIYRSAAVHQFATFFLARIDEDTLRMRYSNAGHNYPIVFRADGSRTTLERGGTVVGILESTPFEEDTIALQAGDRVVFYTDGISEAADAGGELFGEERLEALVAALPGTLTARDVTERILDGVRAHLGATEAGDDMTVMVLRVLDRPTVRPGA
jgi:serine phosphatase RsbU (regulator of sigma subunit)